MSADWLEFARIAGLIVAVWFALVGWKLVPLLAAPRPPAPLA